MYIWIGIDTDASFSALKPHIARINAAYGFQASALPMHISLKMSFRVEDAVAADVTETLTRFFKSLSQFEIPVDGIAFEDVIVWIRMRENLTLNRIHDDLNALLSDAYGIGLHAYDRDYLFHTTLFMDEEPAALKEAYEEIKTVTLPASVRAERILIGTSPDGSRGSYRVVREIAL